MSNSDMLTNRISRWLQILNTFPCVNRFQCNLVTGDCYCSHFGKWVRINYCRICDYRRTKLTSTHR